ncbi:hypothetical protein EW15_2185 [Prochlorococcus sp. MIT 0801]|nr:hypothetical protein EW15_2185 [Prochlorococcus sp. MIT 0801]
MIRLFCSSFILLEIIEEVSDGKLFGDFTSDFLSMILHSFW